MICKIGLSTVFLIASELKKGSAMIEKCAKNEAEDRWEYERKDGRCKCKDGKLEGGMVKRL